MPQLEQVDVLIVGSGPAGMSTALHLVQADSGWADRLIVVEKAVHPRDKLCGGGVTSTGEEILKRLGLSFAPPHIPVREMHLVRGDEAYLIQGEPVFRVTRRDEFDHWLVQCGEERGITVRQGEAVKDIIPGEDYIEVVTERSTLHAQVVVAADGSRSFVRQKLKWNDDKRMARLLEVLTPDKKENEAFREGIAVFDFSRIDNGLQGYYWDFPSLIKGQAVMNRGLFDSRARPERPRSSLKQNLAEALADRGCSLTEYELKGHPIHWFSRQANFSMHRLILVGDAAGVDPLLGEGISFALGYGDVAAEAIIDAFARSDFGFRGYKKRILTHPLLSGLAIRTMMARFVYWLKYSWQINLLWNMISLIVHGFNRFRPNVLPLRTSRLTKKRA